MLFTYLTLHLANHALGLISVDAMETGRRWFLLAWRNPLGALALYAALVVHAVLAIRTIYRRRTFRMPAWEATQLLLGLGIPPLLIGHIVGTRISQAWYGQEDSYHRLLLLLWTLRPELGAKQAIVLAVAWIHGCIGMHFWLRLRPWYGRLRPLLFGGALLLPVLALLGFADGGRAVAALAREPGATAPARRDPHA